MIRKERRGKVNRLARRRRRIRKRVRGTAERPRLSVARTCKHIYAQVIDDEAAKTLAFAATTSKSAVGKTKTERARWAGARVAELALERGIKKVVFDRGGRRYHGRIKAVADGAREAGLDF
ncbi:MAG: 50S ribosomal protein L18 [Candidatus Hydrogenedentota bacterium]|nr:MAG: 50S ribosomal protein L18 [Candidatus Hydrogenedentota bacterium]